MRIRSGILTGTALGLLMAAAPAGSAALAETPRLSVDHERAAGAPVVLAQANDEDKREKRERRREKAAQQAGDGQSGEEKPAKRERSDRGEERQKPAEEKAEAREKVKQERAEKAAGEGERRERQGDAAAQRGEAAEQPERQKAEPKPTEKEPAREKQQERAEKKQQKKQKQESEQAEQRRDQRAKPERGEAAGEPKEDSAQDKARAKEAEPSDRKERAEKDGKRDAAREQDRKEERRDAKSDADRGDKAEKRPERRDRDEKAAETPERRESGSDAQAQRGEALPENAAPVLDSQKRAAGNDERRERSRDGDKARGEDGERDARGRDGDRARDRDRDRRESVRDMPLPDSDRAAQRDLKREEFRSLTAEKGRRIDREDWRERERRDRRDGADVIKEFGDRFVLQLNDRRIVQSSDQERMRHRSRDVYYEELPRERTREVIVRENGFKVVTIRDRYGDIIRRSRIAPDGQEYVLVYASDRGQRRGGWNEWRDPGRDLPPLNLTIPASEYILEAERVQDPDVYYQFLEEPPVEPVQQLYSLDDVKYSARIRDMVRRIDLDTINFEFGSASVNEAEVDKLESVADAMGRLLDNNPGETFLIEGHTDAVGSDVSNLALSDERASSVASALTDVFGIPPENLVTQGYGEQYLKIETEDRERENRRVAIRRITPLVTPVASAQ